MRKLFNTYLKGDPYIWGVVLVLSIFGILAVYSSTASLAYAERGGNTEYYLLKHVALLIFGLFAMWLTHLINIQYFSRISQLLLYISVPLLLYTLFFGVEINDAKRWVSLPVIQLTIQTSDIAKLALIAYVARFMAKRQGEVHDFKKTTICAIGLKRDIHVNEVHSRGVDGECAVPQQGRGHEESPEERVPAAEKEEQGGKGDDGDDPVAV